MTRKILGLILILLLAVQVYAWALHTKPKPANLTPVLLDEQNATEIPAKIAREINFLALLAAHNIFSLDDYITWLENSAVYKEDADRDIWSSPEVTLLRGYGDCEDLSFLSAKVIGYFGYPSKVLAHEQDGNAHVITIFEKNGAINVFDNTRHYITSVKNLKQIAQFLYVQHKSQFLLELTFEPKTIKVIYTAKTLSIKRASGKLQKLTSG